MSSSEHEEFIKIAEKWHQEANAVISEILEICNKFELLLQANAVPHNIIWWMIDNVILSCFINSIQNHPGSLREKLGAFNSLTEHGIELLKINNPEEAKGMLKKSH